MTPPLPPRSGTIMSIISIISIISINYASIMGASPSPMGRAFNGVAGHTHRGKCMRRGSHWGGKPLLHTTGPQRISFHDTPAPMSLCSFSSLLLPSSSSSSSSSPPSSAFKSALFSLDHLSFLFVLVPAFYLPPPPQSGFITFHFGLSVY